MNFLTSPVNTTSGIEIYNLNLGTSVLESSDTIDNHLSEHKQNQTISSVISLKNSNRSYKNIITKSVLQFVTNLYKNQP